MPLSLTLDSAVVLPLRGIIFQCLLLLVAIALEAMVLRRRLRLGFQPSIRYATTINLLAVVLGWIVFLGLEPWLAIPVRTQLISYILFGHFYTNSLATANGLGVAIVVIGLIVFFLTFWTKATALEWLTWALDNSIVQRPSKQNANRFRYRRSPTDEATSSPHMLAVLQANALSFSAVLLLLLVRYWFFSQQS
jgi:hypothetical protein